MQYRQAAKNPFEEGAGARPFQAALNARAGEHHEFRHPVRLNRKKQTLGHYTSTLMQVSFPYHSSLELAGMQWLDLPPFVRAYWPQPLTFLYEMDGDLRPYTPDVGVVLSDGRAYMVEVKTKVDAEGDDNRRRWPRIAEALRQDGYGLAFLLDDMLQARPLANHLRAIQRFKGAAFDPLRIWNLQTKLDRDNPWPVSELLPIMADEGFTRDEFFSLVLYRHLYIDLRRSITDSSDVWIPSRAPRTPIWGLYNAA